MRFALILTVLCGGGGYLLQGVRDRRQLALADSRRRHPTAQG